MTTLLSFGPLILVTLAGIFACILIFFGDIDDEPIRHTRHKSKRKSHGHKMA